MKPFQIVLILAVLLVTGYGVFEARRLFEGPQITIFSPTNGSATSTAVVTIAGVAQNISFLTINDKPAFTDEKGYFFERLSPPQGYAIFTISATDRFGRRLSKKVQISMLNYCPVNA